MQEIISRHNMIVDRICKAAGNRWNVWKKNQTIGRDGLKPVIVLKNGSDAMIVDVICRFENGPEAFEEPATRSTENIMT